MLSAEPPRRLDLMTHRRHHRTNISLQLLKNRLCSLPPILRLKPVSVPAADRTKSLYTIGSPTIPVVSDMILGLDLSRINSSQLKSKIEMRYVTGWLA
jgi:hypothetical protein